MPERAWIWLPSGKQLDLLDPDPWAWTNDDPVIGLSSTYRWPGYSAWDLPLSVAQHFLRCWPCVAASSPGAPCLSQRQGANCCTTRTRSPRSSLISAPASQRSSPGCRGLDHRYDLPAWTPIDHAMHKRADRLAAANEAYHLVGWSRAAMREHRGRPSSPR
jgi:hypothetical protein